MGRYNYAKEKFGRAIHLLATGQDEIRKRLLLVFQGDLLCITLDHLPARTHDDFRWISMRLQKYDEAFAGQKAYFEQFSTDDRSYEHLLPTRLEASLKRMRCKTGGEIARRLWSIWDAIEEEEELSSSRRSLETPT